MHMRIDIHIHIHGDGHTHVPMHTQHVILHDVVVELPSASKA